jgi:hypothetical protein
MRRKCIRLNPIEHSTLERLYVERLIATDRYMHRPKDLRDLTATFNALTDRQDSPEDILHYMQTKRRRAGEWPTLDGNHRRLPVVLGNLIEPEFIPVLKTLYVEIGKGAEKFLHDRDLGRLLERRFVETTGVNKRAFVLATAMLELRKDGVMPNLPGQEKPFTDFDEAEGMAG